MDCCNATLYPAMHMQPPGYNPLQDLQAFSYSHHPDHDGLLDCNGYGPDYVYNPKEARIRKAMRDQVRCRSQGRTTATLGPPLGPPQGPPQGPSQGPPQATPPALAKKKGMLSPRRAAEQRMTQAAIREQVESGLLQSYDDAFVDLGYPPHPHQEMQGWYPTHMNGPEGAPMWQRPSPYCQENGDCLTPSPHVSPYGGRMSLPGDEPPHRKPKLETSGPEEPFSHLFDGPFKESNHLMSSERQEEPSGGEESSATSSSGSVTTRLPGFQETFGSTEIGRFAHEGFFSSQALELQVQPPPLTESLSGPSDWSPLFFLPPASDLQPFSPGYSERSLYPPPRASSPPYSPPYSPFGFCDYNTMILHVPGAPSPSHTPGPFAELTELQPPPYFMHSMDPARGPSEAELQQQLESEQQAALRRMVCAEPVIIQQNERICVVKETNCFTAL